MCPNSYDIGTSSWINLFRQNRSAALNNIKTNLKTDIYATKMSMTQKKLLEKHVDKLTFDELNLKDSSLLYEKFGKLFADFEHTESVKDTKFIEDIKRLEQKFLTNVKKSRQSSFEKGKLAKISPYHTQSIVSEESDLKTLTSMKSIIADNHEIYVNQLFTAGLQQEAVKHGIKIPYKNLSEGVCLGLTLQWLCSDNFHQFEEIRSTPESKAFIRSIMHMQSLQTTMKFLETSEAKELINLTAAKANPLTIEEPFNYYLISDDEKDIKSEQEDFYKTLEQLCNNSAPIQFCMNLYMTNDCEDFSGHSTGLKITEIDGRKTIHFYDPNYGQMSGEFNEQTLDDIFKILKDYGKNIRILLYPIVKEANITLE